ncbi:hypothetical protein [Pontibacter ummariensis]|uniref:hypothetical protein n=1 Tax=Pontibacter ummariensis TaxID=1610492 RepID=UPI0015C59A27|nr:hypothetical protein [Pontibacter ummariensis]
MYEVKGRHYLMVTATTPLKWALEEESKEGVEKPQGGYVVFALPQLASLKK